MKRTLLCMTLLLCVSAFGGDTWTPGALTPSTTGITPVKGTPHNLFVVGTFTTAERDALTIPSGKMAYICNSTTGHMNVWNGSAWVEMIDAGNVPSVPAETDPRLPAAGTAGNALTSTGTAWQSVAAPWLPLAGGTMSGDIALPDQKGLTLSGSGSTGYFRPVSNRTPVSWDWDITTSGAHTTGRLVDNDALYCTHGFKRGVVGDEGTNWYKVWDAYNDGSGSGLDADTVDGSHASAFALAAAGVPTPANPGDDGKFLKAQTGAFSWQTVPADGDSVIGNEITNATNSTLTRTGAGTGGDPYTLGLNLGNANTWTGGMSLAAADSSAVTDFLINPTVKASGNLIDTKVNGVSKFSVSNTGVLTLPAVSVSAIGTIGGVLTINPGVTTGPVTIFNLTNTSTSGTINPVRIIPTYNQASGTAANTDLLINRTETLVGSGAQKFVSAGKGGGAYVEYYGVSNIGIVTQAIGAAVASADTIAATGPIFHVTGSTQINTITAPLGCTSGCTITIIPDGVFTTGVTGNIALASMSVVSKALILTYDAGTSKWYPSY